MEPVKQEDFRNKRPNLNHILRWVLYFLAIPIIRIQVAQLGFEPQDNFLLSWPVDCCIWWLCFDEQNQMEYPGSFSRLLLSSFLFNDPWQLSLWLGGAASTEPAGEGGSRQKEHVLHTDSHSLRAPSGKHWLAATELDFPCRKHCTYLQK